MQATLKLSRAAVVVKPRIGGNCLPETASVSLDCGDFLSQRLSAPIVGQTVVLGVRLPEISLGGHFPKFDPGNSSSTGKY